MYMITIYYVCFILLHTKLEVIFFIHPFFSSLQLMTAAAKHLFITASYELRLIAVHFRIAICNDELKQNCKVQKKTTIAANFV